jgi:hypothetical protein
VLGEADALDWAVAEGSVGATPGVAGSIEGIEGCSAGDG